MFNSNRMQKTNPAKRIILVFFIFTFISGFRAIESGRLPNVIFILADDIGPGDIRAYRIEKTGQEGKIPTPNLDWLAENGIRFRDANTPAALCAPTRYSIMTGNNSYRCRLPGGVWNPFDSLGAVDPGQKTVGNVMKDAGYNTAFIGKWHLGGKWEKLKNDHSYQGSEIWDDGYDYSKIQDHYPNMFGFDYSLELPHGIQGNPYAFYENGQWMPVSNESKIIIWDRPSWNPYPEGDQLKTKGDSEFIISETGKILAQKTVNFINGHEKKKNKNPFFIYYCSQAVHLPHDPPVEFNKTPVNGTTVSKHGDMIVELDLQIGEILDVLRKNNILDETLILFTSDNGALNVKETISTSHDSSNGYRGTKGSIYEGGTKVPFIAYWQGVIRNGSISDEPVMAHDLMATLYALTNQKIPENQCMDSFNLLPLLRNEQGAKGREIKMYQSGSPWSNRPYNKMLAFRMGNWKLIMESDENCVVGNPFALFNLEDNPNEFESKNLINAPEQKDRISRMYTAYKEYRNKGQRTILIN